MEIHGPELTLTFLDTNVAKLMRKRLITRASVDYNF